MSHRSEEEQYVKRLVELGDKKGMFGLFMHQWSVGIFLCLFMLVPGLLLLETYLTGVEGASLDNPHFLMGVTLSLFCSPALILLGMVVGLVLECLPRYATHNDKSLLIRFYKMLLSHGIDPFDGEDSSNRKAGCEKSIYQERNVRDDR